MTSPNTPPRKHRRSAADEGVDACAHDDDAEAQGRPGRPKDLIKRAAILDAAKRMFTVHGFQGVSMDQIAAEAGVSKLTVYSHFGDKETLFVEAVKRHCERQLPASLFEDLPEVPLRERLLRVARAFFAMVSAPDALAGHRMMCTPHLVGSTIPQLFWNAGPLRIQTDLAGLLERRAAGGELDIDDAMLAAEQFTCLVKGEQHLHLLLGFGDASKAAVEKHLHHAVDFFLRAYAIAPRTADSPPVASARRGKARAA